MNQYNQSVCLFFTQILMLIYFDYNILTQMAGKKRNVIKLVPMNPDVSLAEKDVLKRYLFKDDDVLFTKVQSTEFQEILRTDPTTEQGEAKVVEYFQIVDEWANVNRRGNKKDTLQILRQTTSFY